MFFFVSSCVVKLKHDVAASASNNMTCWEGEVEWLKKGLGGAEGYWREKEKEAETEWVLLKRRDILKGFDGTVEKTDAVIAKRTTQGKLVKDDDFPDDLEEHQYWMKVKTGLAQRERHVEGMEAVGKMLRMGQIEPQVIPAHPHASETPKERIQFHHVVISRSCRRFFWLYWYCRLLAVQSRVHFR